MILLLFLVVSCSHQGFGSRIDLLDHKTGEVTTHYLDWQRVQIREIWIERYHGKMTGFAIIAPYCVTHKRFKPICVREWTVWDLRTEAEKFMDQDGNTFEEFDLKMGGEQL